MNMPEWYRCSDTVLRPNDSTERNAGGMVNCPASMQQRSLSQRDYFYDLSICSLPMLTRSNPEQIQLLFEGLSL